MMNRRYFLKLSVASSSWALLGACEAGTKGLVEPASGDTGVSAHDGAVLYQDAGTAAQDAGTAALDASTAALDAGLLDAGEADAGLGPPFSIRESFTVILNDSTCSKHTHPAFVEAGTYAEDREVHVHDHEGVADEFHVRMARREDRRLHPPGHGVLVSQRGCGGPASRHFSPDVA